MAKIIATPWVRHAPLVLRFLLAGMWIFSGYTKLGSRADVTQSIEAYDIFSFTWADFLAKIIGPAEILGGLILLVGAFIGFFSKVSIAVLVLFIIGLAQALMRGLDISCGCFGPSESSGTGDIVFAIIRDIVLIACTVWVMMSAYSRRWSLDSVMFLAETKTPSSIEK